jgi:hypothetical protein
MKRFTWVLLAGLLATCSCKDDGKEGTTETDGPDCPATASEGAACTKEGRICEYSYALTCPMGCSGGDYHSYQCSKGRWVDYAHSAGAPRCSCRDLDFPKDMLGTWLFYQSGSPEQYVWIRFSALDNTLSDAGTPGQGTIEVLAGPNVPTDSIPWLFCNGAGRWFITARPLSFELRPTSTGTSASVSETYTVTSRQGQIPYSLRGCLLNITMDSASGTQLEACKYPDTQCDAAMKTCLAQ